MLVYIYSQKWHIFNLQLVSRDALQLIMFSVFPGKYQNQNLYQRRSFVKHVEPEEEVCPSNIQLAGCRRET
jgi:hypothetical protein